jgi:hypothetical protein
MTEPTRGPNLPTLAIVSLGLTLAGLVIVAALSGTTIPSPFSSTATVVDFYRGNALAVTLSATLLVGSAVPLGIYSATAYARQQRLGVRVPGPAIGYFGGTAAAIMLLASACVTWALGRPELHGSPTVIHALAFLAFATGGVGFVVGVGLLIAGLAVPAVILHTMPAWFGWVGLVLAGISELSFLSLAVDPLQALIPIGRFGGLLWLIVAGFLLPKREVRA